MFYVNSSSKGKDVKAKIKKSFRLDIIYYDVRMNIGTERKKMEKEKMTKLLPKQIKVGDFLTFHEESDLLADPHGATLFRVDSMRVHPEFEGYTTVTVVDLDGRRAGKHCCFAKSVNNETGEFWRLATGPHQWYAKASPESVADAFARAMVRAIKKITKIFLTEWLSNEPGV
jgi:hypothetical protein